MSDLPKNAASRALHLARLPFGLAGRATVGLGKRIGGESAEAVFADVQRRTAEQLFRVLGELKGGAMKVGQALSVLEAAIPEELAGPYRATLTKLQDSAPAMSQASVHAVLAEEFGPQWRTLFESFDDEPTAAASIGQVHQAVWSDGRRVAVKLQYPGAAGALRADLNQIGRLAQLFATLFPGLEIKPLVAELKARIEDELDYALEAEAQEAFAAAYADDPDICVPRVVRYGDWVLITEWIDGTPLSQVISAAEQTERDHAALLLTRFLFSGPTRAGMLHADPHPGNYRLTPDGRLGVVDFGLVNRLPEGLPVQIGRLLRIALDGDADTVLEGLRAEGFIKPESELDAEEIYAYLSPFIEPAAESTFTFTRSWLREQFQRVGDPRNQSAALVRSLNLPPAYLLIHRVWSGGVGVLAQLNAEVPLRAELQRWLPGFADPSAEDQLGSSRPDILHT